jgi:CRP-like cAMP-binding protein
VAVSTPLFPGYEEITIFGGCVSAAVGVSIYEIPKLANTTVVTFGKMYTVFSRY